MSDLNFVSGSQRRGGSSATAIQQVEETLAKIASLDDTFHAVSQVFEEPARRHAEGLDLELAEGLAPRKLHGVPFLAKELVDIAGAVTRFGSHSYATLPADKDAPIIERLKAAGATLIGTSQMVEFAYGSWGTNYLRVPLGIHVTDHGTGYPVDRAADLQSPLPPGMYQWLLVATPEGQSGFPQAFVE